MKYLVLSLLLLGCNGSTEIKDINHRIANIEAYIHRRKLEELQQLCEKLGGRIQARDLCLIEIKGKRIWLSEGQY